ncbi:MAG: hypothetical protein JNN07_27400 [Verrucomicrobiales bacterium]|nr:hypothetical protein [Verrucomicrobiales bacterium]
MAPSFRSATSLNHVLALKRSQALCIETPPWICECVASYVVLRSNPSIRVVKALLLASALFRSQLLVALGQGSLTYQTTGGVGKEKYLVVPGASLTLLINWDFMTPADLAGFPKIEGSGFYAELWWAPGQGQTESSLQPVPGSLVTFRTGATAGLIQGKSKLEIPDQYGGDSVTLQLRVWDNRGQRVATWTEAEMSPADHGRSNLFDWQLSGLDRSGNSVVGSGNIAAGLHRFYWFVPEPSSLTIGSLGAISLLLMGVCARKRL